MSKIQYPIFQEEITEFRSNSPIDDNMYHQTNGPLGDSYPSRYMRYQPLKPDADEGYCLLGRDGCSPLCSGYTKNPCNLVAPIPGPQWQVQTAATVQNRLTRQEYTPSKCPLGPTVLRSAPECVNSNNDNRGTYKVDCIATQKPPVY